MKRTLPKRKDTIMLQLLVKIFLVLLISSASLSAEASGPDYFSIRDVAYNDVLWMHPRPDHRSPRIQGIPPNASCVKNLGYKGKWCKVSYKGIVGWVNARYLREGDCKQSYNHTQSSHKTSYYNEAVEQTIQVPQVSWGACMLICEDNAFCKNADHNNHNNMCTLHINTDHPGYKRIYRKCFNIPHSQWRASYKNDRWQIGCTQ